MAIIFVKTRYHYKPYDDFWRLVELSRFDTCYVDEVDIHKPDTTYIVTPMNGEWRPMIDNQERGTHTSKLYLWNIERPGVSGLGAGSVENYIRNNQNLIDQGYVDAVYVSDRKLANTCGFRYITLGSHPWLGHPGRVDEKEYDVIALSCYSLRRSWLFNGPDQLKAEVDGLNMAPNSWDDERHFNLIKSRFLLNIHQDGLPYGEPLKWAVAIAYGLHIITENTDDLYPYIGCKVITNSPIWNISATAKYLVSRYVKDYDAYVERSEAFMNNFSFKKCVEDVID